MNIFRSASNPIIRPGDVKPSRSDFKVVCVFNAGVIKFDNEVLLLLRVAEVPRNDNPNIELVPVFEPGKKELIIKKFNRNDESSWMLTNPGGCWPGAKHLLLHLKLNMNWTVFLEM